MAANIHHSIAETLIDNSRKSKSAIGFLWQTLAVALGVAIIAASAKIQVPLWPNPTPVTLQTLAIFAIAASYGSRLGVATLVSYLALGAMGAPVFAGIPVVTGGYLLGFVVMAWITGKAADLGYGKNPLKMGAAMLVGEAIMLSMGALWMGYAFGAEKIIAWGVGPFIITDLIKLALAAGLTAALYGVVEKLRNLPAK